MRKELLEKCKKGLWEKESKDSWFWLILLRRIEKGFLEEVACCSVVPVCVPLQQGERMERR